MIRVAAVGDVHYDRHSRADFRWQLERLSEHADLFLLAGDLTQSGSLEEARALAEDLSRSSVPVVAVLGNHDFHLNRQTEIQALLAESGVRALEATSAVFRIRGLSIGVMGLKGFGGGFFGACVTEFGEGEMKSFARLARAQADILRHGLSQLDTDLRFALLHYSPIEATLAGEKREIFPFLGNYLLAEAVDEAGADAVFHGHAHHGIEKGFTPAGIPVRNVALPVIRHFYNIYSFSARKKPYEKAQERSASLLEEGRI